MVGKSDNDRKESSVCWMQYYRLYSVPTMPFGNVPNFIDGNIPRKQVGNAAVYLLPANTHSALPHCTAAAVNKVLFLKL